MTHSLFHHRPVRFLVVTTCLLLVGFAATANQAAAAGFETPEACFNAAKEKISKKDYAGFVACLTPKSQNLLSGMFSLLPTLMQSFAALGGEEAIKELETKFAGVNAVIKKHGIDTATMPGMQEMVAAQQDETKLQALFDKILTPVKDRPAYLAELMKAFEALGDGQTGGPKIEDAINGELKGLQVNGDTASATLVVEKDGQAQEQPFNFKKTAGGWLIDLPLDGPGA